MKFGLSVLVLCFSVAVARADTLIPAIPPAPVFNETDVAAMEAAKQKLMQDKARTNSLRIEQQNNLRPKQ